MSKVIASDRWRCVVCEHVNSSHIPRCEVCDALPPARPTPPPRRDLEPGLGTRGVRRTRPPLSPHTHHRLLDHGHLIHVGLVGLIACTASLVIAVTGNPLAGLFLTI